MAGSHFLVVGLGREISTSCVSASACLEMHTWASTVFYKDNEGGEREGRTQATRPAARGGGNDLGSLGTRTVTDATQEEQQLEGNEKMEGKL